MWLYNKNEWRKICQKNNIHSKTTKKIACNKSIIQRATFDLASLLNEKCNKIYNIASQINQNKSTYVLLIHPDLRQDVKTGKFITYGDLIQNDNIIIDGINNDFTALPSPITKKNTIQFNYFKSEIKTAIVNNLPSTLHETINDSFLSINSALNAIKEANDSEIKKSLFIGRVNSLLHIKKSSYIEYFLNLCVYYIMLKVIDVQYVIHHGGYYGLSPGEACAIRLLKIPYIELQHSTYYETHPAYNNIFNKINRDIQNNPDTLVIWNKIWKEKVSVRTVDIMQLQPENSNINPISIYSNEIILKKMDTINILYANSIKNAWEGDQIFLIQKILHLSKGLKTLFKIRLHPKQSAQDDDIKRQIQKLQAKLKKDTTTIHFYVSDIKTNSIEEDIINSNIVIAEGSPYFHALNATDVLPITTSQELILATADWCTELDIKQKFNINDYLEQIIKSKEDSIILKALNSNIDLATCPKYDRIYPFIK